MNAGNSEDSVPAAFDHLAASYDAAFSNRLLGRTLRGVVHAVLGDLFSPGDLVLDMGCGSGEDALYLAASGVHVRGIDVSKRMVALSRMKAAAAGLQAVSTFSVGDLDRVALPEGLFDGAFSNFGAMNCVRDREGLSERLAGAVRAGGAVALVVMGPFCPWEWLWYGARGQLRTASRRLRPGQTFRDVVVDYPSADQVAAEFARHFEAERTIGIGVLLPPTFGVRFLDNRPRLLQWLAAAEARIRSTVPACKLNDHYLLILRRREP